MRLCTDLMGLVILGHRKGIGKGEEGEKEGRGIRGRRVKNFMPEKGDTAALEGGSTVGRNSKI